MYIPDLEPYCYELPKPLPSVLAVGWLASVEPIQKGICPYEVLEKLNRLILREAVNQWRGTHTCDFCGQDDIPLRLGSAARLLGSAELWVPDHLSQITFAAPNLISHYITAHQYLPPEPFMEAVRKFDEKSTWNGELKCDELSREAFE